MIRFPPQLATDPPDDDSAECPWCCGGIIFTEDVIEHLCDVCNGTGEVTITQARRLRAAFRAELSEN